MGRGLRQQDWEAKVVKVAQLALPNEGNPQAGKRAGRLSPCEVKGSVKTWAAASISFPLPEVACRLGFLAA